MNRIKRGALLSLILTCLILGQLPAVAQTRRPAARQRPAAPARPAEGGAPAPRSPQQPRGGAAANAARKQAQLVESPKGRAMAVAFETGKLPEPARLPPGSVDERAAALAKAVAAGDDSSTAALYAAVLAAGYGVRDEEGNVLQTTERGQGLAFDAWEVASMAKLYGEGYGVGLGHLGETFTRHVPEFNGVPLASVLVEGLRAGAQSDHPAVRFWARFIVELGRQAKPAYDLLGRADAAKARLDAVQTAFILKRLAGDVVMLERRERQARGGPGAGAPPVRRIAARRAAAPPSGAGDQRGGRVTFVRAAMRRGGPGGAQGPAQLPCSLGEMEGLILDYNALAMTTGFGLLAGHIGQKVSLVDKYGKGVSLANLVLVVLKFIASYAFLETKIAIDGHPLVRTKDTKPNERLTLSAELKVNTGKWQTLNCVRPALNVFGLDFNLPGDGPLNDVKVEWKLVLGGDTRGVLGVISDIPAILGGNATYGDGVVYLEALPGADRSPAKQYTDGNGVSRVYVVGNPQPRDLTHEKLTEVNKVAGVRVDVQLKTMKIKDAKDVASNAMDIGGSAIAFLTGDMAGAVVGTIAETLYRSNWYRSEPFYFLVKDWEPCAGQWSGTINHTVRMAKENNESPTKPGTDFTRVYKTSYAFTGNVQVRGANSTGTVEAEEHLSDYQKSGYGVITFTRDGTANYSGSVDASVSVSSDGRYDVGFLFPNITGTTTSTKTCERPAPYKCHPPSTSSGTWSPDRYIGTLRGTVDPNKPGVIEDSQTWQRGDVTYSTTVSLKRCQ